MSGGNKSRNPPIGDTFEEVFIKAKRFYRMKKGNLYDYGGEFVIYPVRSIGEPEPRYWFTDLPGDKQNRKGAIKYTFNKQLGKWEISAE